MSVVEAFGSECMNTYSFINCTQRLCVCVCVCIAGLLKELICSHDDKQLSEIADSALQLVPSLPSLDREDRPQRTISDQLHSSAIALWNR